MKPIQFIVLGWAGLLILVSLCWVGAVFFGPIKKMEQNGALAKSSLNYYSRNTFMVETCTVAALMGLMAIVVAFLALMPKPWMGVVSYIIIGLSLIGSFATAGYFGYTYYRLSKATNVTMASSLALWEEKFGCCGWDSYRQKPLCASDIGSLDGGKTCKAKTENMVKACFQNFVIGSFFTIGLIVTIVLVIILQSKTQGNAKSYIPV